jgi:copper(I)-binding protein
VSSVLTRRRTTLLAAGLLPLALTACGSGLNAETYRERTAIDAANADVGAIALRDVAIEPPPAGQPNLPAGSDATARLALANNTNQPDELVQVTSPDAASVELVDKTGKTATSIPIPASGLVGPADFSVRLKGLTRTLWPASYVEMTFVFQKNGRTTLPVPVRVYSSPAPRPAHSEGGTGSEH